MKQVAIVGKHPATRDTAPWNDPNFDIWIFNESVTQGWVKRWDAVIELHSPRRYRNPQYNDWEWLQQDHGKLIYMQEADEQVPCSTPYPLDEVCDGIDNLRYKDEPVMPFKSTVAYAIALALYEGYEQIDLYGIEMEHSSEYHSQQPNFAFWVGVAVGRGVKVNLHCSRGLFDGPLYAYEYTQDNRVQSLLDGMKQQRADVERQATMLEGAMQLARQLLEDEAQ